MIISITATVVCMNFIVIFFSSFAPAIVPSNAAVVAASSNARFSLSPEVVNRVV